MLTQKPDGTTIRNLTRYYEVPTEYGAKDSDNITPEILAAGRDPVKVFEALGLLL